jgi:hypothetical protein
MSRVNPLYLLALFSVLFLLSLYTLMSVKQEQIALKHSYQSAKILANDLQALQTIYTQKNEQQKRLDALLKSTQLKDANFIKEQKKSLWHVTSSAISQKELEFFLNKILNESYPVKSLTIKREQSQKARIDVEIQW